MKRWCAVVAVLMVTMVLASSSAWAQPGGARGGFRGGFGGFGGTPNLMDLAGIEAVQKEIEALDDQVAAIKKAGEEARTARDSQRGQRPDFQNMSDAEREKAMTEMRARRDKEATAANAKLGQILLPHQMKRLQEISLQQRGTMALSDPKVAAELKVTDEQKKKLEEVANANMETMRTQMQQLFQGGNRDEQAREQARTKMQEMRKQADEKVLAVLTADQKAQFAKMKGAEFKMPEGAFGFGAGGRQGRGTRGGQGGQRPQN